MSLSEQLFELIKTLSKTEKRYIKIFSPQSGETDYLKLFDTIEKMKTLNESKIEESLANISPKRLSAIKSYLYNHILKGLHAYHANYNHETELKTMINHIDVLFGKGLYSQCLPMIYKAKKIAKKYEFIDQYLNLLRTELKINSFHLRHIDNFPLYDELEKSMNELLNFTEVSKASSQIFRLHFKETLVKDPNILVPLKKLLNLPILKSPEKIKTYTGKLAYHRLMGTYYRMIGEKKLSQESKRRLMELFETRPEFIEERPLTYIESIHNLIIAYLIAWDFDQALNLVTKLKSIKDNYKLRSNEAALNQKIFISTYSPETAIYLGTAQYQKCVDLYPEVEKNSKLVSPDRMMVFHYNFCMGHFALGNYEEALKFANKIFALKANAREDILLGTRIMNLVIHYKMGNSEYLDYEIRSMLNSFRSNSRVDWQVWFTKQIRELNKSVSAEKSNKILNEMKITFENIVTSTNVSKNRQVFHFFTWVEAELEGKEFHEISLDKINKYKKYLIDLD